MRGFYFSEDYSMLVVLGFGVRRFGGVLKSSDIALIETSTPTDPSADFISAVV